MLRVFRRSLLFAMVLCSLCHAGSVQAQMRILETLRYVFVSASLTNASGRNEDSRREETTGFGIFDEAVSLNVTQGQGSVSAAASQTSTLPQGIGYTLE